jgi:hypothetical protein
MNRTAQFIIGLLAVALAIGAGIYGRNTYLKEVSTYQIPVPVTTIQPYMVLTESMFQMRDMPRTMETLPYYQSLADLKGLIATSTLPAGLPVAKSYAVSPAVFRLADPAFEVISIPVEPVSAVGGQIQIGQRLNLYQVIQDQGNEGTSSNVSLTPKPGFIVDQIAAKVLVVDVRTSQGVSAGPNGKDGQSSSVLSGNQQVEQVQILTLALEPERVQPVLDAVAVSKKQGGLLWTSLAVP